MFKRLLILMPVMALSACSEFEDADRKTLQSVEAEVKELRKLVECYELTGINCPNDNDKVHTNKVEPNGNYLQFPAIDSNMTHEQKMLLKIHRDGEEVVRRLVDAEIKNPRHIRVGRPNISGSVARFSAVFDSDDGHSRMDVDLDFGTDIPTIRKQILVFKNQSIQVIEQPKYKLVLLNKH